MPDRVTISTFADKWDAKPISGLDTTRLYAIHAGEDEAAFDLRDCYRAREALSRLGARGRE